MTTADLLNLLTQPIRVVQIRPVSYAEYLASPNPAEDLRLTGGLDVVLWADGGK
jgi:hypothetical protein